MVAKFVFFIRCLKSRNIQLAIAVVVSLLMMLHTEAVAKSYNDLEKEELHGPVKTVKRTDMSTHITYYDQSQREVRSEYFLHNGQREGYTETVYAGDSSVYTSYDEAGKAVHMVVTHYDRAQRPIRTDEYLGKDSIWVSDSLVYNQWNKVAAVYHCSWRGATPAFYLCESYKFDSIGNIIGGRTFNDNHQMVSGYEVVRTAAKTIVLYASYNSEGLKKWQRELFYDKKGRLRQVKSETVNKEYSKFDKYGNWTECVTIAKPGPFVTSVTATRTLSYW